MKFFAIFICFLVLFTSFLPSAGSLADTVSSGTNFMMLKDLEHHSDISAKWPGLGMGIYTSQTSYVNTILANGFEELRIDIPSYENNEWLEYSKSAVTSATSKGARVIWGISTGETITSSNWLDYRRAVLNAAQWAQDNGVFEFQLGNELDDTIDGTTLTLSEFMQNMKSLATEVQSIFTNGNISYSCLPNYIGEWASVGKGNIDLLASNVYMTWGMGANAMNWERLINTLVSSFGADGTYLTEFNLNTEGIEYYSTNESIQAAALSEMIDYIRNSGIARAIFYCWKDDGEHHFGAMKNDGTYRLLWEQALLDSGQMKYNCFLEKSIKKLLQNLTLTL